MRGTKRAALSDSLPVANEAVFKKVELGSLFGSQRAEPLQQPATTKETATTSLDIRRAESARKHVRALNNQFASWVQAQQKSHPDELWEDGLRDYLSHASKILEDFSDVVNWLKENAVNGKNSSPGSYGTEKKLEPEMKNCESDLSQETKSFTPVNPSTSFAFSLSSAASNSQPALFSNSHTGVFSSSASSFSSSSQSGFFSSGQFGLTSNSKFGSVSNNQSGLTFKSQSGLFSNSESSTSSSTVQANSHSPFSFSNNQAPVFSGSSLSVTTKPDVSGDVDGDDEIPQPSSPSVKKSEEKGIVVVHEVKCKLYVKSNDPADKDTWKDKGTGQLCIKCIEGIDKGTKESKPTIVVRNDVGKVLLNALLYPGIKTNVQKNSLVAIFHTSDDSNNENVTPRTFLMRTKTADDRDKLATAIKDYAPSS